MHTKLLEGLSVMFLPISKDVVSPPYFATECVSMGDGFGEQIRGGGKEKRVACPPTRTPLHVPHHHYLLKRTHHLARLWKPVTLKERTK